MARIWAEHGLKPWQAGTFTISSDPSRARPDVAGLQHALLRGDVPEIRRLVDAELAEDCGASLRRARLLAGRSFAHILDSDFAAARDDAQAGLDMGFEQPLFRALCALSSGMGGLERDGVLQGPNRVAPLDGPEPGGAILADGGNQTAGDAYRIDSRFVPCQCSPN